MCKTPACCSFYDVACLLHAFEINEDLSGNRCSRLVAALFAHTTHRAQHMRSISRQSTNNLALRRPKATEVKTKERVRAARANAFCMRSK